MENTADIIYEIANTKAQGLSVNNRELKQRRGRRQRERQKSNRFRLAKQQLCKITKVIDELKGGISGTNLPEEWQQITFDYVHKSKWK